MSDTTGNMLSAFLRATAFKNPLLRTVVPSVALAYGIQGAVAVPSIISQSERFYDLSGSLTYISCTAFSLALPLLRARFAGGSAAGFGSVELGRLVRDGSLDWRKIVLSAAVGIWATRLGTYLFQRIQSTGHDSRFDSIRGSPPKFLGAFFAQATWVSLCALPVLTVNALPATVFPAIGATGLLVTDVAGVVMWATGFGVEVAADGQKSKWMREKAERKHDEEFLTKGWWSIVRYPNYSGEILSWCGIATLAGGLLWRAAAVPAGGLPGGLVGRAAAVAIAGVSPAFVTTLLTKVSGIPMSEKKYDGRYGDRADYKQWKENTPALIPKIL